MHRELQEKQKQRFADLEVMYRDNHDVFKSQEDCEQQVWDSCMLAHSCETYDEYKLQLAMRGIPELAMVTEEEFSQFNSHRAFKESYYGNEYADESGLVL